MPLVYHCKSCGGRHDSPISLGDRESYLRSAFANNGFQCPVTQQVARYDKADLEWEDVYPCEIKSGNATVVASGTAITYRNQPIEVAFGPDGGRIRVVFRFVDAPGAEPAISGSAAAGNALDLTLTNFGNPLGMGLTQPQQIGTFAGKNLWLSFRVHTVGEGADRTLTFTFYTDAPAHA